MPAASAVRRRRRRHDHPGADGVVRRLVDDDEAAGRAVARVGVERERPRGAQPHAADVVEAELAGRGLAVERVDVDAVERPRRRSPRTVRVGVLDQRSGRAGAAARRPSSRRRRRARARARAGRRAGRSGRRARRRGRRRGGRSPTCGGNASSSGAVEGVDRLRPSSSRPPGSTSTSSPGRRTPLATWPGVAAVVVVLVGSADHVLHREAQRRRGCGRRRLHGLEVLEQRRPAVPGHRLGALDDVVALAARRSG